MGFPVNVKLTRAAESSWIFPSESGTVGLKRRRWAHPGTPERAAPRSPRAGSARTPAHQSPAAAPRRPTCLEGVRATPGPASGLFGLRLPLSRPTQGATSPGPREGECPVPARCRSRAHAHAHSLRPAALRAEVPAPESPPLADALTQPSEVGGAGGAAPQGECVQAVVITWRDLSAQEGEAGHSERRRRNQNSGPGKYGLSLRCGDFWSTHLPPRLSPDFEARECGGLHCICS